MLVIGQVLQNRYTIQAPLGQGGMGAAYKAFDSRTNVLCVVKELTLPADSPQELAQAQQQFAQEAMTLAKLRHPNLPRVTDHFSEQGSSYLVMDLIEGRSLQDAIGPSGLPETQVASYAAQLLDAIDYCHSQNVLHRDIKPQNIVVQPDGKAVLVDFGLVKLLTSTNRTHALTNSFLRGLGTPNYAPPEQYSGGTDARSDVYAFGATLYHALTGRLPPTATDRSAGVKVIEPHQFNASVSPHIEQAITKAMMLDMTQRFQTARDFKAALARPAPPPLTIKMPPPPVSSSKPGGAVAVGAGVLMLVVAGVAFALFQRNAGAPAAAPATAAALAPLLTAPPTPQAVSIAITSQPTSPPAEAAVPAAQPTADDVATREAALQVTLAALNIRNTRVALEASETEVARLLAATATRPTTQPAPTAAASLGQGLIAYHAGAENARQIYIADPSTGNVSLLPNQPANCRVPNWSSDGTQLAFRCAVNGKWQVFSINVNGTNLRQLTSASQGENFEPAWSPDGSQIAFLSTRDGNKELYVMDADGGNPRRVVANPNYDDDPQWSPDGAWLVFESTRTVNGKKREDIYKVRPSGAGLTQLTFAGLGNTTPAWSPDGRWIAYETHVSKSEYRVWIMDPSGGSQRQITFDGTDNGRATWSPDSLEIAYTSDAGGGYAIWIVPIDGSRPPRKISQSDGYDADWSP